MSYITLEQIQKDVKINKTKDIMKSIFWELFRFSIVFWIVFLFMIIFINFNVFYSAFKEKFFFERSYAWDISAWLSWYMDFDWVSDSSLKSSSDNFENLQKQQYMDMLEQKFGSSFVSDDNTYEKDLQSSLKSKIDDYKFDFNLLPPDKRVVIDEIFVDAPIVDIKYATTEKIRNADYDEELFDWVVKYPSTPNPDSTWAVLIFGHTSYYWWKKNPYWEIFAKLPRLVNGSNIKIYWWWHEYEYEVIDKVIKYPSQVSAEYEKYKDGKYLIIMWCYPIWTSSQRILIIAKQK